MKTIKVIPPGSDVVVGDNIRGLVDQVVLKPYGILYSVTWWNGADKKEGWFHPHEVRQAVESRKKTIGFAEKEPHD